MPLPKRGRFSKTPPKYDSHHDGMNVAKPQLPTDSAEERRRKREQQRAAEDQALRKEIDDAVRQDDMAAFGKRYGPLIIGGVVLALAAFAGFLYWDHRREQAMEQQSETLIAAIDQIEAGNLSAASQQLDTLSAGDGSGAAAVAALLKAGIALENGNPSSAAQQYAAIADNGATPDELRDLARLRQVAVQYDSMPPAQVVTALRDLATPGSAYFGSAGEMTAMALLDQGRNQEAGALFAEIATTDDVPETIKSRARQMAGLLGVDTIENVNDIVGGNAAPRPAAPTAATE